MSEPGRARRCVAGGADEMCLPLHAQFALLVSVACRSNSPARAGALRSVVGKWAAAAAVT